MSGRHDRVRAHTAPRNRVTRVDSVLDAVRS